MSTETSISDREREILRLVATGATNQQIAAQLNISVNTVKVHLRNIFGKIGVASRTEATIYAMRAGIVELAPDSAGVDLLDAIDPVDTADAPDAPPPHTQTGAATANGATPAVVAAAPRRRVLLAGGALLGALGVVLLIAILFVVLRPAPAPQPTAAPVPGVVLPLPEQRWRQLAPLPAARSSFALVSATVDERRWLYVIGGSAGGEVSGEVLRYDLLGDAWETLRPMPLPLADVQAAIIGERVYVPGGRTADGAISDQLAVYDPRTDEWANLSALPAPRSAYGLAVLEGKLYLFGGWDGAAYHANTWQYNPDTDSWAELTPMPTVRAYAGAVAEDSRIYLLGGENESGDLAANERYTPSAEADGAPWDARAPLPEPRSRVAVTTAGGLLFAIGGDSESRDSLVYNLNLDQWQPLRTPLTAPLRDLRVQSIDGRVLYIIGGSGATESADVYAYQAIFTVFLPASDAGS
jgi:DNA-binding CsgD family transcriptional regulator